MYIVFYSVIDVISVQQANLGCQKKP